MATVDGQVVKVGDYVSFKCDIEQSGRIKKIVQGNRGPRLLLESLYGFHGDYIGGETEHYEDAVDCWLD